MLTLTYNYMRFSTTRDCCAEIVAFTLAFAKQPVRGAKRLICSICPRCKWSFFVWISAVVLSPLFCCSLPCAACQTCVHLRSVVRFLYAPLFDMSSRGCLLLHTLVSLCYAQVFCFFASLIPSIYVCADVLADKETASFSEAAQRRVVEMGKGDRRGGGRQGQRCSTERSSTCIVQEIF